jgi:xanthine dehydrogenase small subunit
LLTFESETGTHDNVIIGARIAMGGVGPVVLRPRMAENSLVGKTLSLEAMMHAGKIARQEISAITDVRGSDEYRRQLAENILVKCYYDLDLTAHNEVTVS